MWREKLSRTVKTQNVLRKDNMALNNKEEILDNKPRFYNAFILGMPGGRTITQAFRARLEGLQYLNTVLFVCKSILRHRVILMITERVSL